MQNPEDIEGCIAITSYLESKGSKLLANSSSSLRSYSNLMAKVLGVSGLNRHEANNPTTTLPDK